jgi:hypothetical protein
MRVRHRDEFELLGYTCARREVDRETQCCRQTATDHHALFPDDISTNFTRPPRFACDSCDAESQLPFLTKRCCRVYEYCVSCCMRPEHVPHLASFMKDALVQYAPEGHPSKSRTAMPWYAHLLHLTGCRDRFELCSNLCRTSSQSNVHQNLYIDQDRRHCMPVVY